MNLKLLCQNLLKQSGYWVINKHLVQYFQDVSTVLFLSNLIDWEIYFAEKNQLVDGEWFYGTYDKFRNDTFISHYKQRSIVEELVEEELLFVKMMGYPTKQHYKINYEKLSEVLISDSIPIENVGANHNENDMDRPLENVGANHDESDRVSPPETEGALYNKHKVTNQKGRSKERKPTKKESLLPQPETSEEAIFNFWNTLFQERRGTCHKSLETSMKLKTAGGKEIIISIRTILYNALKKYSEQEIKNTIETYSNSEQVSWKRLGVFLHYPNYIEKYLVPQDVNKPLSVEETFKEFKPLTVSRVFKDNLYMGVPKVEIEDITAIRTDFDFFYQKGDLILSNFYDLEMIIIHYLYTRNNNPQPIQLQKYYNIWKEINNKFEVDLAKQKLEMKEIKLSHDHSFRFVAPNEEELQIINCWNNKYVSWQHKEEVETFEYTNRSVILQLQRRIPKDELLEKVKAYTYTPHHPHPMPVGKVSLLFALNEIRRRHIELA